MLSANHHLSYPVKGDFLIDDYFFKFGVKTKSFSNKNLLHSFVANDDIEIEFNNKIPLQLFGFLY